MDLDRVREYLRLMDEHDLAELEVEDKDTRIRLKKEPPAPVAPAAPVVQPAAQAAPAAAPQKEEELDGHVIASPLVGTFYRAPSPDSEPFVEVGDPVDAETVVCIVEAMKVMNEVKAEVAGTIKKVLVENGTPVEYGQPLFVVSK